MELKYFDNALESGMSPMPNQMYRQLEQAFINQQWENTIALQVVNEQDMVDLQFPSFSFHETEAWLNYVVGQTSTGTKEGRDFVQLIFKCLDHPIVRGRYYQFDDCYWIGDFTDTHDGVVRDMTVRRCNNWLRIKDPENGAIYSIPCVIGYDMASPSNQVTTHIITPNNHATIMVQGNQDTLRLFKTNTRYILGGRPFKLTGYQNAIEYSLSKDMPTLLYLDLYLDELHPNDDLINQLADNGRYDYEVAIINKDMSLLHGAVGKLYAEVMLNGDKVDRAVTWRSNNVNVVSIDDEGNYQVVGEVGQVAIVSAIIGDSVDSIEITVSSDEQLSAEIFIDPVFNIIKEYDTVEFRVGAVYGGVRYDDVSSVVTLDDNRCLSLKKNGDIYALTATKRTKEPQTLSVVVSHAQPMFEVEAQIEIAVTSMIG